MQTTLAFLFGAPGGPEILLILVAVLLMFGPRKLPEIARSVGKAMETLRKTSQEFRDQVMSLDKELPKVDLELPKMNLDLDENQAAVVDDGTTQPGPVTENGQTELPFEKGDTSSTAPADPYGLSEDKSNSVASQSPEPQNDTAAGKEQENAAEIKSSAPENPSGVSSLEHQEDSRKDGIAG